MAGLPFLNAPNTCTMRSLYAAPHDGALYPFLPPIHPSVLVSVRSNPPCREEFVMRLHCRPSSDIVMRMRGGNYIIPSRSS